MPRTQGPLSGSKSTGNSEAALNANGSVVTRLLPCIPHLMDTSTRMDPSTEGGSYEPLASRSVRVLSALELDLVSDWPGALSIAPLSLARFQLTYL